MNIDRNFLAQLMSGHDNPQAITSVTIGCGGDIEKNEKLTNTNGGSD